MSQITRAAEYFLRLEQQVGTQKAILHTTELYDVDRELLLQEAHKKDVRRHPVGGRLRWAIPWL